MIRPLPLAAALALLGGAAHAAYAIEHVTVIDGTGAAAKADMTVVIEGDRIAKVTPTRAAGASVGRVIDGRGKYPSRA